MEIIKNSSNVIENKVIKNTSTISLKKNNCDCQLQITKVKITDYNSFLLTIAI